jgi:23S rRNA pseudouridine1911/1915/1917 synthase
MSIAENRPARNNSRDKKIIFKVTEPTHLLKFLIEMMPGRSRTTVKSILANRLVVVGKRISTQFNHPLEPGMEVCVYGTAPNEKSPYQGVKVVFEDDSLVVIEKRSGLLSIATDKETEKTAYSILSEHVKKENRVNRIFVVHRLDKDASGLMMFAKSAEVQKLLQHAWQETVLERGYVVVVEGKPRKKEDTFTSWLRESKALIMYSSNTPGNGQVATTHYRLIRQKKGLSLLQVNLETGRKNQIRVHMQALGHPIAGDKKYGAKLNPIGRLALHANILAFRHPVTGEELRFETPVPPRFTALFG